MDELTAHPREEIERLEEQIEELTARIESCRKFIVAARVAMTLGVLLMGATVLGLIAFDTFTLSAAIAAVLGGIVVSGSNRSTAREAEVELAAAEASRSALIGRMEFRVIDGGRSLH